MRLFLVPVTKVEADAFVNTHHRHNDAPIVTIFQVGVANETGLVGVAVVALPNARKLMDGVTLEVKRVCVLPDVRNANSMLYGACARAAKALGWRRLITYTLPSESGASLKATGWTCEGVTTGGGVWVHSHRGEQLKMFGKRKRYDTGPKQRWVLEVDKRK